MNEILGSALLWPAEQLVNSVIRSDPHVQKQLSQFAGRRIEIAIDHFPLPISVAVETDGVKFRAMDGSRFAIPVDARVKGSASTLSHLLLSTQHEQPLVNSDLQIEGDAQLVQDMFTMTRRLDIQWEDLLSPFAGDIGTQQLSQAISDAENWAKDSQQRMRGSVDDYLKEELRLFPHSSQLEKFQNSVDNLKLKLDRVEARARRLLARTEELQATKS